MSHSPTDPHDQDDQTGRKAAASERESEGEKLISAEELVGPEWAEWYAMTPAERWAASERLFAEYVAMGGSLEPEVDTQSPFWSEEDLAEFARHRPIDRINRRPEGPR